MRGAESSTIIKVRSRDLFGPYALGRRPPPRAVLFLVSAGRFRVQLQSSAAIRLNRGILTIRVTLAPVGPDNCCL